MLKATLYPRQRQILEFIRQFMQKFGYSPTLHEIAHALNLKSLATVHEHLNALERKKVIKRYKGKVRGLKIADEYIPDGEGINVPVIGFIAAGRPIEPYHDPNASIQISPSLITGKKHTFVLQVRGDSMIEEGILDGDYVVIEEKQEAKNGEIVVAVLQNGLATLKRFFREKNKIKLAPANSAMAPIYVTNVQIKGKVVGVIRKY